MFTFVAPKKMLHIFLASITAIDFTSGFFYPEYHHKFETKDQIIISLDDENDDLELTPEKTFESKTNLKEFHKHVKKSKNKADSNQEWNSVAEKIFKSKIIFQKVHEKSKQLTKRKRSEGFEPVVTNLKNTDLKTEYEKQILGDLENKRAYNYSDEGKPEESIKEAVLKIIDITKPPNCSKPQGFGIKAIKCIYADFKNKDMSKKELAKKIGIILAVWFAIYLIITIPLWCLKGWCCCCFRCEFCQPYESIKTIQEYITQNPPGIYINSKGEEEHYSPSIKETEIYQELNKSILNF